MLSSRMLRRAQSDIHSIVCPAVSPILQADLQAAELAKRALEAERQEVGALRDELRKQQAAAAAEAARLAELQQVQGWGQLGWSCGVGDGSSFIHASCCCYLHHLDTTSLPHLTSSPTTHCSVRRI